MARQREDKLSCTDYVDTYDYAGELYFSSLASTHILHSHVNIMYGDDAYEK